MQAAMREYNKTKGYWLAGKQCAVFGKLTATEVHHKFGRAGRLLLWTPGWIPVSKNGHRWIHDNPQVARDLGYFGPVGTWNDYKRAVAFVEKNPTGLHCL